MTKSSAQNEPQNLQRQTLAAGRGDNEGVLSLGQKKL